MLLSFAVAAWFLRREPPTVWPSLALRRFAFVRALIGPPALRTIRVLSVALFVLVIVSGLWGPRAPDRNIAPVVVWVIWWVGLAFTSAFVGDVWRLLNPWKIVFGWAKALVRRRDPTAQLSLHLTPPPWLGVWPAVALFGAFAWFEIVAPTSVLPANVTNALLLYSAITWGGMLLLGEDAWLRHGEAFTVAFGLLARFAPLEVRRDSQEGERMLLMRPWAVGLARGERISTSMMVFTILLLSTVTFDGFTATPVWLDLIVLGYDLVSSITWLTSIGLALSPLGFLALYLATCALMRRVAGGRAADMSVLELGRCFVLTLVPIALAYHLAHYLTYLLVQAQLLVPIASDPLGLGWNLFGTLDYVVDVEVVGPRATWWLAVGAVVGGHVIAVYLAHLEAQRLFHHAGTAIRSQLPMLVLMVAYTVISLWILAQPIVEVGP